jgi:hypothetical protein
MATGYVQTTQGLQIEKDTEARLTYTFDWVDWLPAGDTLSAVTYTITTRANDPDPLVRVSSGIQGSKTYIQLREGPEGKTYIVTAAITTTDGLIDRRYFRVKVLDRSA